MRLFKCWGYKLIRSYIEHKRDNQLFDAFSLSQQELLKKKPSYDFEDLTLIAEAYFNCCNELQEMGKHELGKQHSRSLVKILLLGAGLRRVDKVLLQFKCSRVVSWIKHSCIYWKKLWMGFHNKGHKVLPPISVRNNKIKNLPC